MELKKIKFSNGSVHDLDSFAMGKNPSHGRYFEYIEIISLKVSTCASETTASQFQTKSDFSSDSHEEFDLFLEEKHCVFESKTRYYAVYVINAMI